MRIHTQACKQMHKHKYIHTKPKRMLEATSSEDDLLSPPASFGSHRCNSIACFKHFVQLILPIFLAHINVKHYYNCPLNARTIHICVCKYVFVLNVYHYDFCRPTALLPSFPSNQFEFQRLSYLTAVAALPLTH